MSKENTGAIVFFVLAVLFAGVAINNTFVSPTVSVSDESGLGVSRMDGAFLPSIICAGVGAWLWQRTK